MLSQAFFWGTPAVVLVCYSFMLLFISIAKKDRIIRAFSFLISTLFLWTLASLLMKLDALPGVVFWNRMTAAALFVVPFSTYNFLIVYAGKSHDLVSLFIAVGVILSEIANLAGKVIMNPQMVSTAVDRGEEIRSISEFAYETGPALVPAYLVAFFTLVYIFYKSYRLVAEEEMDFDRLKPLVYGVCLVFLGVLTNAYPPLGKYPFDILMSFINALFLLYAIYKNRLLELRFVLTRGAVFYLLTGSMTFLYIVIIIKFEQFAAGWFAGVPYIHIFSSLFVALLFQPLYSFTRSLVDKMFYNNEYVRRMALKNFNLTVASRLDLADIFDRLTEAITSAFGTKRVYMLLRDPKTYDYVSFKNLERLERSDLLIARDNPVVNRFGQSQNCLTISELSVSPQFKSMWAAERSMLKDTEVEVLVPLKCGGELIGILLLTDKENKMGYTLEDLDLLGSLGASAAVATDNARMFEQAKKEAIIDDLTLLYNHRFFRDELAKQLSNPVNKEFSLLIIDLDMFKLYNDLYGHLEGDKALQTVAGIIKRTVGGAGCVCRYGGEEFTVLLPGISAKRAYEIAEEIRIRIQESFLAGGDSAGQRFLTVSTGICTYPLAAAGPEELIRNADLAVYKAKRSGKNQSVTYSPALSGMSEDIVGYTPGEPMPTDSRATIFALTAAIDTKDHYTFGHSQKVAEYAKALAEAIGLDDTHIEMIYEAGLLHDIGKIGIPENILTKESPLDSAEFETMKKHVDMSITIVKHLPSMNHVIPSIVGHHERWDGKGYPRGVKGKQIPIGARCLAIVDAFDAMVSDRPYKVGREIEYALGEILDKSGTQFDPEIAPIFVQLVRSGKIQVI